MKFELETIYKEGDEIRHLLTTARAKVFGGWIILSTWWIKHDLNGEHDNEAESVSISQVFVSDPDHEWVID